jgi:hypothetical protein
MQTHHGRMTLQDCRDKAFANLQKIEADLAEDRAADAKQYATFDADDIRDAEIRGATWALERTLIHNYIGQSTRDKDIAESASRIVDARRKEK